MKDIEPLTAEDLLQIRKDIGSNDVAVRKSACSKLGDHKAGLELLEKASLDDDPEVREATVRALCELDTDNAHQIGVRLLHDENPNVIIQALQLVNHYGDAAGEGYMVLKLAKSKHTGIRGKAYQALGRIGGNNVSRILLDALNNETNPKIKIKAAEGLRHLADPKTLDQIIPRLIDQIEAKDRIPGLISQLTNVVKVCKPIGSQQEVLIRVLLECPESRSEAAKAIGYIGYEKARTDLERALSDASDKLVRSSASSLLQLGPKASISHFRELLDHPTDDSTVRTACRACSMMKDRESLAPLKALLAGGRTGLRAAAFNSIAEIDETLARELAFGLLRDNNIAVRNAVLRFLEENQIDINDGQFELSDEDTREFAEIDTALRPGQEGFRQKLINVHGLHCLISVCHVPEVLEAAHIKPYRGEKDNNLSNGLLLRADIHRLFDDNLIGIEPTSLTVHISDKLSGTAYEDYDSIPLATDKPEVIDHKALVLKWRLFEGS